MNRQDLQLTITRADKVTLQDIYRPVTDDLAVVKRLFLAEMEDDEPLVAQLCDYISQYHGKMLRPGLLVLSGAMMGQLNDAHRQLATVIEMLHVATLVHDDILDNAKLRRKSATVRELWGDQASLLLGDLILARAFDLCNRVGNLHCSKLISQAANVICRGELLQCRLRGQWQISQQQYLQIIERKTACLYQLCCHLGAYLSGANPVQIEHLAQYGRCLGMAFQIIDDLLDIAGKENTLGKTLGKDLQQGKSTLPIIHFLAQGEPETKDRFWRLLDHQEGQNHSAITQMLEQAGSLDYCRQQAQQFVDRAVVCLNDLPNNACRKSLEQIAYFILDRVC